MDSSVWDDDNDDFLPDPMKTTCELSENAPAVVDSDMDDVVSRSKYIYLHNQSNISPASIDLKLINAEKSKTGGRHKRKRRLTPDGPIEIPQKLRNEPATAEVSLLSCSMTS